MIEPEDSAQIGVLGGSGNYGPEIFENVREVKIYTPFGAPSSPIILGEVGGRGVAFIARHGRGHVIPPTAINFRANIWAFKKLGVGRIISPCACGGIAPHVKRGEFVVLDQLFDRTKHRVDSFFPGGVVGHIPFAEPFCPELRGLAIDVLKKLGFSFHGKGTYVCVEGPRFSTRAESGFYRKMGFDVVGMTALQEAALAREAGICFLSVAMVTDTDVHGGEEDQVSVELILKTMKENVEKSRRMLAELIPKIPREAGCVCGETYKTSLL